MQSPVARQCVLMAIEMHEKALAIYQEHRDPEGQVEVLRCLAKCYRSLGDDEKALQLLAQSLAVMEEFMDRAPRAP